LVFARLPIVNAETALQRSGGQAVLWAAQWRDNAARMGWRGRLRALAGRRMARIGLLLDTPRRWGGTPDYYPHPFFRITPSTHSGIRTREFTFRFTQHRPHPWKTGRSRIRPSVHVHPKGWWTLWTLRPLEFGWTFIGRSLDV